MAPILVPELVTSGELALRPWEPSDAAVMVEAVSDPEMRDWAASPLLIDGDVARVAQWCELRADWSDGTHASWAVTLGGDLAGGVSLFHLDHDQLNAEVGYFVLLGWRRRCIATRALEAAAGFAFGRLELLRVQLFHAVENEGSCGVAERAGFRLEGTHRMSFRYGDGRYHDEHCHARLSSDGRPASSRA